LPVSIMYRSFASGEVGPEVYGRADQERYQSGLRTCRNFVVRQQGGVSNRFGTGLIAAYKDEGIEGWGFPFIFNREQAYLLEFGNGFIRFIRLGLRIRVSGVAAWDTLVQYEIGDLVVDGGINYYARQRSLGVTPAGAGEWYALEGDIYEIPSPYEESELPEITFSQAADLMMLNHPSHPPMELIRLGETRWTLLPEVRKPGIEPPTNLTATGGAASTFDKIYVVTSVEHVTFRESLPSNPVTITNKQGEVGNPIDVKWSENPIAGEYNVYRQRNGVYGFIGIARGGLFRDRGYEPDSSDTPPIDFDPFNAVDKYPSAVSLAQGRRIHAGTNLLPEVVFPSRAGDVRNFTTRSPLLDDDSFQFSTRGNTVNRIRHVVELGGLLVLTSGGVWTIESDQGGLLLPGLVIPKQRVYDGVAQVRPVISGGSLIYVDDRSGVPRELRFFEDSQSYEPIDMSIYAVHLFDDRRIVSLDAQRSHDPVVWAGRSDGTLLGVTFLRHQNVMGWHRHDTVDGEFKWVVVLPEGNADAAYLGVKRAVNGVTRRYIERMEARRPVSDVHEHLFVDSALTYDGTNTDATLTMTLTGGVTWDTDESLTLTSSASYFVSGDVGNSIVLESGDDTVKVDITVFTNGTTVTVKARKDVPASLQGAATAVWGKAVDEFSGLEHLESETVAALGDGAVLDQKTVVSGAVSYDDTFVKAQIGLPITADFETLDLDATGIETPMDKRKVVSGVTLLVDATRGIFAGPDADHLREFKQRTDEPMGDVPRLLTGKPYIITTAKWNNHGRLFVRQSEPLPITILAAIPRITVGGAG